MRRWLKQVAEQAQSHLCGKRRTLDCKTTISMMITLYITILRDPVDRAISSYWFEGRWPQEEKNRTDENAPSTCSIGQDKSINRHEVKSCGSVLPTVIVNGLVVVVVEKFNYNHNVTNALARLKRFDVVVQMERLKDENYTSALQMALNATEFSVIPRNVGASRHAHSNYTITQAHMNHLAEMNR